MTFISVSYLFTIPALVTTRRKTRLLVTVACLDNLRNTSALLLEAIDLCTVLDLNKDTSSLYNIPEENTIA